MATEFRNLDTDTTLGGNFSSDYVVPSQKAIKTYVDNNTGGGTATDVQINSTSITSNGIANIITNSAYNSSSNKIATMSDLPKDTGDLTNNAGYIKGITSSDVTNALGYTPYNSANPNGYTSNVGTVTSVNNVSPVNGNVSLTIPQGTVTSVNNTSPDNNGNVSLTIPTVNNATLTIQKNGTAVQTFTANASSDVTCNITVPTDTNDLTNGAGFITSSALSSYQLIAQSMTPLSASGTINLSDNTINKIYATGITHLKAPSVSDMTKFHQIFVQLKMTSAQTIYLKDSAGTVLTNFFNKTSPDLSTAGTYNIYFEYDNDAGYWVVGTLPKGTAS